MSLKNINEIQTNDYRYYDQSFLKETLNALANSGQRFGSPGSGVTISYFKTSDCFNTSLKTNSYIQCAAFVSNTDIQSYRDMYGDIMRHSNVNGTSVVDSTYLKYYNIYKDNDVWASYAINTVRHDVPVDVLTSVNDNAVLPINTASIEKTENRENVNSYTHVICAYYNSIYYTGYDGTPKPLEYSSAFDINNYTDTYNNLGNQFAYIYLRHNVPSDGARYTYTTTEGIKSIQSIHIGLAQLTYSTDYNGSILGYFKDTLSSYRYYILTYFSADSDNTVNPSSNDVKNVVRNAKDYYTGINLVDNIFSSNFKTPYYYTGYNAIILRNARNSSNVEYFFYDKETGISTAFPDNMGTLLAPSTSIISDIIASGVSEAQKTVSDQYKENIRKTFLDTLMWKTAYDYVSEYISDKTVTSLDYYTEINTYLSGDMRINVYASSLDSSVLYGTSSSVHGEYCTNADISKTISKKILAGNNKFDRFVSDWSDINAGKYDEDYQLFDVYDRNTLFNIKAEYTSDGTSSDLLETGNVYVSDKYTLPFINTDKYWCINGEQTPIRAVGLDADQPSVIVLASEDGKTADVKSTLHKNDIVNYIKFYSTSVNIGGVSAASYGISTPVIDVAAIKSSDDTSADILKFVKSALIMSIIKSSGEIEVSVKDGYVTTFWVYNEELDKFTAIANENGFALDLSTLASVSGIINAGFSTFIEEPGKYKHDQLILTSDLSLLKNEKPLQTSDGSKTTEILGAIQNFGTSIMKTEANADEYGVIPYSNTEESISTGITTVIGLFDKSEVEKSSKYVNKSIKYGYENNLAIKFNSNGRVNDTVKQMRYDDLKYKSETRDYFVETNDYIPASSSDSFAYQPSLLDMSSMFINHANALNRINILTLGGQTTTGAPFYYSYIGTSYENGEKANLVIGTATRNVDVSRHIIHVKDTNNFSKNTSIDINFDKINLNGDTNVNAGIVWHKMGTSSYYYTNVIADTDIIRPTAESSTVAKTPYMDEVTTTAYTIDVIEVLKNQYKQTVVSDSNKFPIPLLDYYNGDGYIAINKFQDILCIAELADADKKEYKLKYAMPIKGHCSVAQ